MLGRLQQEGARAAGQLAVDPDRGLAVGQQPAGHRDRPGARGPARGRSSRRESTTPVVIRTSPRSSSAESSKQRAASPVWQAGADLVHPDEQRVAVAVQRHRRDVLMMPGRLALDPERLPAAGPVGRPAAWSACGAAPRRSSRPASAPRRCRAAARSPARGRAASRLRRAAIIGSRPDISGTGTRRLSPPSPIDGTPALMAGKSLLSSKPL